MTQNPQKSSLFVSQVKAGPGMVVSPAGGTGIVTISSSAESTQDVNTPITTVGAGTLTAAAIVGGVITRSGPVAAFTDTTDTAVAIAAAIANASVGQSFYLTITNTTAFLETLAAGVGVTLSGLSVIPANSVGRFLVTLTSLTAVSMMGIEINSNGSAAISGNVNTAISTVGAGTLTAAGLAGGVITRSGSVAAYSDATDTAVAIVAAIPNAAAGQSFFVTVINTVGFAETITAGVGVTLSGFTIIPANSAGRFLVTLTSLTAVAIQGMSITSNMPVPNAQFKTQAATAGVVAVANMAGAAMCYLQNTNATPGNQTTPTAAALLAAIPGAQIGFSYTVRVINTGAGTWTWVADASVTLTGTTTIATNITRDYIITFTSGVAATMQSVGSGVSP